MRHVLSFLGLFFALALFADDVAVTAKGIGDSYRLAVDEALISAMEQHCGVSLSEADRSLFHKSESTLTFADGEKAKIESQELLDSGVKKASQGRISRFEVVNSTYDETTKKYTVEIKAYLLGEYVVPNDSARVNRARMAVGTFYRKAETVSVLGTAIKTETWTEMFANALTVRLTQSQKFNMLDRRFEGAVADELKRLSDANVNPTDAVRLCKQMGTDYLLVGSMLFCDVLPSQVNPYTGEVLVPAAAPFVDINYRVILAATGELKWTDNVRVNTADFAYTNPAEFVANSAEVAAKRIADGILSALLPLELVDITSDGHVVIGEGGLSLVEGEVLTVFGQGKEIFDSRTGESLGMTEEKVGLVIVDRVTEKMSYGRVLEGDISKFQIGKSRLDRRTVYVVDPEGTSPNAPIPTEVRGTGNGGVVVPF